MRRGINKGFTGYRRPSRNSYSAPRTGGQWWHIFNFLKGLKLWDKDTLRNLDWMTIGLMVFLMMVGFIGIGAADASPPTGDEEGIRQVLALFGWDNALRQLMWIGVGIVAISLMLLMDYVALRNYARILFWVIVGILALLFVLGSTVRDTQSWFRLGEYGFQPSEIAKIVLIIMMSRLLAEFKDRHGGLQRWRDFLKLMLYFVIPLVLILLQPDLGTALVFVFVLIVMLFLTKANWRFIATVAGAIAAIAPIAWFYVLEDYQKGRLISFIDPKADPAAAYNVAQSKAAIGSGQLTGKGLLSASQVYVPAKRTDFIFSAVSETFGFIGAALVLIAFALLIFRLFRLANQVKDPFGSYIILGVMAMTAFHTFENIGMSMGLMPVTGIPLPLVSYGGSNLLANMLSFGIVLNIAMRNKKRSNLGMARNFTTL